jgi:hypothetical protein
MLVGAVVVDDPVNVEVFGHTGIDVAQEAQKLLMPMAGLALGEDLAIGDVQGRERGRGAVAHVVKKAIISATSRISLQFCG